MALNLTKHRNSLLEAWKDVLDEKSDTNWALFGYEGQTNDLKVVSKGAGGIEEMTEDLNSGKIMYAFCRVQDPKTSLPKCVLINWQGEGAPLGRKGTCANHVRDVAAFFKGAHVTMNARNEEEVDPQLIIEKVAKSTGSAYSFKERADNTNDAGPVGTTYKRVIPRQEIDVHERDQFWEREQREEQQRQAEERKRREEERRKLEEERHKRELAEAAKREARIEERTRTISQQREAERSAEQHDREIIAAKVDAEEVAEPRVDASERLRQERNKEAQDLISQRKFDARAVFEKNTCAGQLHNLRRASATPPDLSANSSPLGRKASLPVWPPKMENGIQEEVQSVPTPEQSPVKVPEMFKSEAVQEEVLAPPRQFEQESPTELLPQEAGTNPNLDNWQVHHSDIEPEQEVLLSDDVGLRARALYDYQAADATEITFDPGDIITHIDQIDEGWWQGLGPDGTFGLFPANYVELID
ncbi:drebrin-like protein [Schistocerca cancellata]|uniref:drebrin-like protein n=1 Tax=Schistocerca cancellata TaxID=274614 RepID=UPI002118D87E|nr:drebrin-like protein [Schistocerca cancellata]